MKVIAKPIEMIAWFTKHGCPNPVRFRVENDDHSFYVIKVDRVIKKDIEKLAGNNMIVFMCQSIIDSSEKIYEIKYELRTCKWVLYKM
jgi:hypothetical protein